MTDPQAVLELDLRRQALGAAVSGARLSVPLLWGVIGVLLLPSQRLGFPWATGPVAALALVSGLWRLSFMHRLPAIRTMAAAELRRAEWQIEANAAMSGLMWALVTIGFFPRLTPGEAVLHGFVLAGSLATAGFYMSLIGRSFEWIALPMMLPLIVLAAVDPRVASWPLALISALFLLAMLRAAADFRRTTLQALRSGMQAAAANDDLRAVMAKLEAELAAKSRFLATMSHEIHTPMAGMMGALDLMDAENLSGTQHRLLDAARQASESLMASLGEVLDHARIETDQLESRVAALSLADLVAAVSAPISAAAAEKGVLLRVETTPGRADRVQGECRWLEQVLRNLLSNALKFTERGQVTLRVGPDPQRSERTRFVIEDTGSGIPAVDLPRLFLPFQQLDEGPQRAHSGAGLGLVIAQRLVQRMGGQISVRSVPGQGSSFEFSLALPPIDAAAPPEMVQAALPLEPCAHPGAILVAEDNELNRLVAVEMLQRSGMTVRQVANGQQAVEALQAGGIALVLMDGQMPVLDGYAATRQWREREQRLGTRRIPIVALSANVLPEDLALAMASGMDDHLAKPFTQKDLVAVVSHWLEASPA